MSDLVGNPEDAVFSQRGSYYDPLDDDEHKSSGGEVEEVEDVNDDSNNRNDEDNKGDNEASDDVRIVDSEPRRNLNNFDLIEKVCV